MTSSFMYVIVNVHLTGDFILDMNEELYQAQMNYPPSPLPPDHPTGLQKWARMQGLRSGLG